MWFLAFTATHLFFLFLLRRGSMRLVFLLITAVNAYAGAEASFPAWIATTVFLQALGFFTVTTYSSLSFLTVSPRIYILYVFCLRLLFLFYILLLVWFNALVLRKYGWPQSCCSQCIVHIQWAVQHTDVRDGKIEGVYIMRKGIAIHSNYITIIILSSILS